jgi:hypothetical protein
LVTAVGALSCAAYACSSDTGVKSGEGLGLSGGSAGKGASPGSGATGGSAGSNGGGTGGSAATGGSSATGAGGTAGTIVVADASAPEPPDQPDAACATGTAEASLRPVNMLVMFDRSGSMREVADETSGSTRWDLTSGALTAFFQDPGAAELGVALRFFPHDSPAAGCNDQACSVDACSQVLVDMGKLSADAAPADTQEAALVTAVMNSAPSQSGGRRNSGGTPISAALEGALDWAASYQAAHPEERTVVILATDGEPNGCDENYDHISQIAADALASSGVSTYAIGLQNADGTAINPDDMNQLAAAGGTEKAFFVSDGPTTSADLLAALNSIRGMAIACDFAMPASTTSGQKIDPNLLNVSYTLSSGDAVDLTKVAGASDCGSASSWYYDDEAAPTRIMLCPAACDAVTNDAAPQIEILAGCMTQVNVPR